MNSSVSRYRPPVSEAMISFEQELQEGSRAGRSRTPIERTIDPRWLLVEEGFQPAREHEIESLLAISNGYSGTRGSLVELSVFSSPATFVAGVFQQSDRPESIPELMVLPDWCALKIWIDHQPLSLQEGEILEHRRILDLRRGMLWREWRHRDPSGRITRIVGFRLASLSDRHLLLQSLALTAENYSATVEFESAIEVDPSPASLLAPDWIARSRSSSPNVLPLALRASGRETAIIFGFTSQMLNSTGFAGVRRVVTEERRIIERCDVNVEVGTEYQLHRFISLYSTRETPKPFECVIGHLQRVLPEGVSAASFAHASEWESRWQVADVEIDGDEFLQKALRFAGYHLIGASNPNDGRLSIGARGLTGRAYMGHVFWDTEIYMLPFFIFTHPASARALLEYRYHTLKAARERARDFGFRGAMYPWESADTGEDVTPKALIVPTGEVIRVRNAEMEIHITADIAFAVCQYWKATGDDDFLLQFGAEILLESARFWASRGTLETDGAYHIRHVIGPDEYHEDVDDDAYTNLMAAWNLRRGAEMAEMLKHRWPERWRELAGRLQLMDEELMHWPKLAEVMFIGFDPKTLLFEQFSGYFRKEHVNLKSYEGRSAAMDVILGFERIQQTDILKQPDVVLAMFLLWNEFPPEVRDANFRYYEPRTAHGSSLSPSIHALMAARLGNPSLAHDYLKQSSEIDLGNNMGNAAGGVHMAAQGGLWQAVVFGFAGFNAQRGGFSLAPNLLPQWLRLSFPLQWRKSTARVSIEPAAIRIKVQGEPLTVSVIQGTTIDVSPENEYIAERSEQRWKPWRIIPAGMTQEVL